MGLDIMVYIEVRKDGRWMYTRPEPPHVLPSECYADCQNAGLVPLLQDRSHMLWYLLKDPDREPGDKMARPCLARRGLPVDISPALKNVGRSWAKEPPPGWLTLRELQGLRGYGPDIDEMVVALQGYGGPDDVRIVYEFAF